MTYPNKSKFIALYKAAQAGHPSAEVGLKSLSEEDRKLWEQFVFDAGAIFLEVKDELDQAIEELGDIFSDADPRNWKPLDWHEFYAGIEDNPLAEILKLYAEGKSNMELIWQEIGKRL